MRLPHAMASMLVCIVAFLLMLTDGAFAQRKGSFGGSRSSSSSRPSYSRPSPSYSRPSPQPRSPSSFGGSRSSSPSSSGYGSSARPSYSSPSRSTQPRSTQSFGGSRSSGSYGAASGSANRSSQSATKSYGVPRRETYNGQSFSYRTNSNAVPVSRSSAMIPRNYTSSYNDIYSRRNNYYTSMQYAPPSYIGYTSPSYGLFSTMFLLSAMQNMQAQQNAMFFYNHWNNPGMMSYRNDMYTAARTDPEAASRLRDLEAKVSQLEREKNGVRDTTYMPQGVDSSVVLSNEALGVQDNTQTQSQNDGSQNANQASEKKSGGLGFGGWVVILVGVGGVWWWLRRRKRKTAESENEGSFS
jgi:hypothetical protein